MFTDNWVLAIILAFIVVVVFWTVTGFGMWFLIDLFMG
jgi:hypothetical protein